MATFYRHVIRWSVLYAMVAKILAEEVRVNLNGFGCDSLSGYDLKTPEDVVRIYAVPNYETMAIRADCTVVVRADKGRRIEYIIEEISFNICGVDISIYDNPTFQVNPLHVISCEHQHNLPIKGKSKYNEMSVVLRKTTSEARAFSFRMRMKNDLGAPFDFEIEDSEYEEQGLEPGIIAGIAIAGGIIIVALILLAIYLCIRARQANLKEDKASSVRGESSVYYTGNSEVAFANSGSRPKRYGSTEDIRSTTSSQDKANGAYANPAYTKEPGEKRSERQASFGRAKGKAAFSDEAYERDGRGKAGFANEAYDRDGDGGSSTWEERETTTQRGSLRQSRKDTFETGGPRVLKSAMKKTPRAHSPSRSQTSSTDASLDANVLMHGYSHLGKEHPNVHHKPVIEKRRRSRSGTRSHQSGSSLGRSHGHRSKSEDPKKLKESGRMYGDVFFDDRRHRPRSSSGRRARTSSTYSGRSGRTTDSVDSESSTTSYSRKVSMNPGGKRVHIKGEETDI